MKTKKKWLYIILIIILATPVILLHVAFNGNPLSKYLAKRHVEAYFTETYPDDELLIKESYYNFKDSGYTFEVIKIGSDSDKRYDIIVGGFINMAVYFDGIYYDNLDEKLMETLGKEASKQLKRVLQSVEANILEVSVQMEVPKGKHPVDLEWRKDFVPEKPMSVHIAFDAENISEANVVEIVRQYQQILNDGQYDYSYVNVNGNVYDREYGDWYVEYATSFEPGDELTVKSVERMNNK